MEVGDRFNKGKLRWRNFPMFLMRPLVKIGHKGEEKYGTYNFLKGLPLSDTMDSLHRHLDAFMDPNQPDTDEESGQNHLAHVAWNALVAVYHMTVRPELDDRYKPKKGPRPDVYTHAVKDLIPDGVKVVEKQDNIGITGVRP